MLRRHGADQAAVRHKDTSNAAAHAHRARRAEVNFVLEAADGRLAGIEVKASATVRGEDFKHLTIMRDRISDERFVRGVILYTGGERLPFGERLEAWPVSTLWS